MVQFIPCGRRGLAILAIGAAVSACGGGGDSGTGSQAPGPVPTAQTDAALVARNGNVTLSVLANDSITEGGTLKLVSTTTPAHGSATISGNTIVYVPAPGFFGKDSFSYTVKDAGKGTVSATAQVALAVQAQLVVSGKMVHAPLSANVSITVGATTYPTTTDAAGNFSTPVVVDEPASMISVTAQGIGSEAYAKLASHLGNSQAVVDAAGTGGAVSQVQLPGLNVSSMTTALYALAIRNNGGAAPASQVALDAATNLVAASELSQMSGMVRAVVGFDGMDGAYVLPAGAADTLALLANAKLYREYFLYAVKELSDIQFANNQVRREIESLSAPAVAVNKSRSLTFFKNEYSFANPAVEIVLNPDGTGSAYVEQQRVQATWRNEGGLKLTLAAPLVRTETLYKTTSPWNEYQVQHITKELIIRRLTGSNEQGFAAVTQTGTHHYPTGEMRDRPLLETAVMAFRDWSILSAPSDLGGSTLGGIIDPDPANAQAYEPFQIILALGANGSAASAQLPTNTSQWKLEEGKLVINFASGARQTMARVGVDAQGDERWLARVSAGASYAVHDVLITRVQPGLTFNANSVVKRWSNEINFAGITPFFLVTVNADNTSREDTVYPYGAVNLARQTSWTVQNGQIVMRSYKVPGVTAPAATCPAGLTCTLSTERKWTLLRNNPSGIVVLEEFVNNPTAKRQRINRYIPL